MRKYEVDILWFIATLIALYVGFRVGQIEHRQSVEAVACEPKVDSVVVKPTRWPKAGDPMCKSCMPSDLNGPIPDSARVR